MDGQKATEPTAPTATGYTFGGWYTDAACTTAYNFTAAVTGDVTLYAKWTAVTYTVTFDANGGTGSMTDATGISGNYTLPENGFTAPAGKQFKAWSVGGVEKTAGATITVNANTTVTAIWENIPVTYYTVTFDSNGGSAVAAQNIEAGQKATKPADPTKDGYDFKGWTLNGSAYDFNTAVNGNITLVATWEQKQIAPTTYTVSFAANGGTGTMADVTGISGEYTLPENGFTAPDGKQFKAWSVGGEEKAAGTTVEVTGNIIITAIWEDIPTAPNLNELKNEQAGVTVTVPANSTAAIPAGTVLAVLGLPTANIQDATLDLIEDQLNGTPNVLAFYDLSLTLDSNAVQPNGKVLVTLTVNTAKYDTVTVFYVAADGSVEACVTTVNADGTLTFETDHFSKYAVVGTNTPVVDPTPDTNTPDTNTPDATPDEKDGISTGAVIAIVIGAVLVLGVVGFAIFWFVIKKKTLVDLFPTKTTKSETPEVAPAENIATAVGETTEAKKDSATEGVTEEKIPSDDVQAKDETSTKDSEKQE